MVSYCFNKNLLVFIKFNYVFLDLKMVSYGPEDFDILLKEKL